MYLTPNMYKSLLCNTNAKEIVTLKAFDTTYVQIITLKANAKEIVTLKCI